MPPKGQRSGKWLVCAAESCEVRFYAYPRDLKPGPRQAKFCSRSCAYANRPSVDDARKEKQRVAMLKRDRRGRRNPNFKTGRLVGKQDRELSRKFNLKLKGEDRCRVCGSRDNVQLHHAIPRSTSKAARLELLNGIPLCASHHMGWHRGNREILRGHFTEKEWAFLESVQLTGRVTASWLEDHYPKAEAA